MESLKLQIREEARRASLFSREALEAARKRDYVQSSQFRQQAQEAGRPCAQSIEQYTQASQKTQ